MKMERREFIGGMAAAAAFGAGPLRAAARPDEIRAVLLHLGFNMWCDWYPEGIDLAKVPANSLPDRKLRCRDDLWRAATDRLVAKGMNMVVIDVGEGLVFPSHPELAIDGSWTAEKLSEEVRRLKALGIEAIPKLNFSTTHNGWLKHYRRMTSTPQYYRVCEDLLRDVFEIFGRPRFIHIGSDEEDGLWHVMGSTERRYVVVRRGEIWKFDFLHLVRTVEKLGARAWCWSDYGWMCPEFHDWCPKSVLMSNWFYDEDHGGFDLATNPSEQDRRILAQYEALDKAGFDQVPCGTNWTSAKRAKLPEKGEDIIGKLVDYSRKTISPRRLKGFLMTSWVATDDERHLATIIRGIDLLSDALKS